MNRPIAQRWRGPAAERARSLEAGAIDLAGLPGFEADSAGHPPARGRGPLVGFLCFVAAIAMLAAVLFAAGVAGHLFFPGHLAANPGAATQ
jgi:hypothetical protein